jgi:undecaprenyl-diphosphatase
MKNPLSIVFSFFIFLIASHNPVMDQQLEILINREWIASWADRLLVFLSNYGAWAPWLLALVVLAVIFGNFKLRAALLTIALAVGLCDGVVVSILKHTIARARPSQVEPGVRFVEMGVAPPHYPKIAGLFSDPKVSYPNGMKEPEIAGMLVNTTQSGRSFPSGHAANNMAVATVLILFYRRWGWFYLPVALSIAYARIYTGSHWPLDVLAGLILGVIIGRFAVWIMQFLWKQWGIKFFPSYASTHPNLLG